MRKSKSFVFRNISISVVISIFIAVAISLSSYFVFSSILKDDITKEAKKISTTWAKELDVDMIQKAMKEDSDSEDQQKLMEFFDNISKTNNKVAQAYVFSSDIVDGNKTPLVSAPTGLIKALKESDVNIGDPYPQPDVIVSAIKKMKQEKAMVSTKIYNDSIGTWITELYPLKDENGKIFAYFGVDVNASLFHESQVKLLQMTLFVFLPVLILIIILQVLHTKKSFRPLEELVRGLNEVGNGNFDINLKVEKDDEFGQIVKLFNKVIQNIEQLISKVKETSAHINNATTVLHQGAQQTEEDSIQITHDIENMNQGMNTQKESISHTVIAIDGVASSIQIIAGNSSDVSSSSIEMNEITKEGSKSINNLAEQMETINTSFKKTSNAIVQLKDRSQSIQDFLTIISSIADQTNLLALNAAIEAARAGEAGKGFSVVAEEVKKLAEESRGSTEMIAKIIEEIQTDTDTAAKLIELGNKDIVQGVSIVQDTGKIFDKIQTYTNEVAKDISEVSASAQEISANAEEITATSQELENISFTNKTISDSISEKMQAQEENVNNMFNASNKLFELSGELEKLVEILKVK
ncbi:methyl-accepting chemotaxis protein [Rummeliibacillus suwonensis]|uniref:methyl-accepting chemotaxis protein n=1 Tax=Rummeliibacillus suwonensis TaxID=1306154 RepID=UPI001AAE279B|nr:methyl-accepting chemotaxis protein [Rummeliibacillus suwonensis]MBO2535387.1 methyl-accepting chemotaxis protein [Rummeliibacillus suwonensis]